MHPAPARSVLHSGWEPREGENAVDEWRANTNGDDELHAFCPECAEREFGVRVCRPSG